MKRNKSNVDIVKEYLKKYSELKLQSKGDSNFRDICGNLVTALYTKKISKLHLRAVETYFRLLKEYPEFMERELLSSEGYFPELRQYTYLRDAKKEQKKYFGESSIVHYVSLCEQKLKRK